ncbi:MAG: hypothetical protein H7202_08280 [Pedobacter sp.]|nr:hypothetical protein [Pedobacter sp.]
MRLSEHKDLKIEILALPTKEKDKLLLRLVAKDKVLTEHLHFLLLEDEENLRERVAALKEEIANADKKLTNAKDVLWNLRKLTKLINHFLKVTKANFEEVELRIFLFNHTQFEFKAKIFSSYKNYDQLFAIYFVKSISVTLKKFEKLHEDLQFDLKEDLNKLLSKIYHKNMASIALDLGLPKQV